MKNISEIPACEKCGSPVEFRCEGSTQGLFCTKCEWSVVTTCLPEILRDTTLYEVSVTSGECGSVHHLKTVAQLAGVNFLAARKLLQGPSSFAVFTGDASKVAKVRDMLKSAGLAYEIKPPFPW